MRIRPVLPALFCSLALLCACSGPRIVENTAASITVQYDPVVDNMEDVTAMATKACAAYGKTPKLRQSDQKKTVIKRYAHFSCVSN